MKISLLNANKPDYCFMNIPNGMSVEKDHGVKDI
jgi:hypothetical protein